MTKELEPARLGWHDYWMVMVRRRWMLLGPLFGLGLIGSVLAVVWPVRYRSEALILVEQQKVPEQYVTPNVLVNIEDRLQSMTQQILSRTRLQHLIDQFDLYPAERARNTRSEIVDMMRKDITIDPVKASSRTGELTAFRITYTAPQRKVAQQVVDELTSLFIDDNLRARDQQSTDTTKFLDNQLSEARQRLAETEQHLREYKMQYLGELPEQQQSNLQILGSMEAQLGSASAELARMEQEKTYLESMRAGYKSMGPDVLASRVGNTEIDSLPNLRAKLADLQSRYTDRHPEVIRTKEEIARLEAQRRRTSTDDHASSVTAGTEAATEPAHPGLIEIESRLKAVRLDIENRKNEVESLRYKLRTLQAHLNLTPVREQQLAGVTRDYENAKGQYQSLLQKESQSALATNLEKRQQGEQFRIVDPASLPEKPVEPNRAEIVIAGWFLGLLIGVGLTSLKEVTDTRLYGEPGVGQVSSVPILVSIPILRSPGEDAATSRARLIEAVAACLLVVSSLGFGAYLFYWVK